MSQSLKPRGPPVTEDWVVAVVEEGHTVEIGPTDLVMDRAWWVGKRRAWGERLNIWFRREVRAEERKLGASSRLMVSSPWEWSENLRRGWEW